MNSRYRQWKARGRRRKLALSLLAAIGLGSCGQEQRVAAEDYFGNAEQLVSVPVQDCYPTQPICPPGWTGTTGDGVFFDSPPGAVVPSPPSAAGQAVPQLAPSTSVPDFTPTAPSAQSLTATSGTGGGLDAPGMIGDFIGPTINVGGFGGLIGTPSTTTLLFGGERRFKIAENVSPIPQDRFFLNYHHYHNAAVDPAGNPTDIDRYTFGLERTVFDGLASGEIRIPFSSTLDSTIVDGVAGQESTEFGNLQLAIKMNLLSGRDWLLAGGTTLTLPTGDDFSALSGGATVLTIENEAIHMAPYLGFLLTPNRDWFYQGFVQADFDLNGNGYNAGGVTGQLQDQNLIFLAGSAGRWIHRSCNRRDAIRGIAAIAELHYNATLNDADTTDNVPGIENIAGHVNALNATGALVFRIGKSNLRVGGSAPLRDDFDQLFDGEFFVQWNRFL